MSLPTGRGLQITTQSSQCRLSPSVVLLGTNQCRLQAVRVDALFVVMLLSSLDSVEHVNGKFSWFFSLNIKDVNLILLLIIPYSLADYVKQAMK